ncbi:MAG: tail fiber domain-containing protein, partial [bacterium]|nr:tail fiber domain-containing protein [bacterium]
TGSNKLTITSADGAQSAELKLREFSDEYGVTFKLDSNADILNILYHNNSAAGVSAMAINRTNGNVGIGTTTTDRTLVLNKEESVIRNVTIGASNGNHSLLILENQGANANNNSMVRYTNTTSASAVWTTGLSTTNNYNFQIANSTNLNTSPALSINTTGNVGIGTTSPWRVLAVQGSVALNGLTSSTGSPSALCQQTGGEVTVNAAATCTVSSERFKHNIADVAGGALAEVLALRPRTFVYNGTDVTRVGFIAEEVLPVDPKFVFFEADGTTPRGVRYEELTALLAKAFQEMNEVIDLSSATTSATSILIDAAGNVGVGTSTPEYKLHVMGDVAATSFVNISTRTAKKDIEYYSDSDKRSVSDKIRNIKIAEYRYNGESESAPLRLGLIAEEAPAEVLSASGKGVDVYKLSTFILAGVQEQQKRLEGLEVRMVALESLVASSTPQQGGGFSVASVATAVKDLIASGGEWVVSKITASVGDFGTAKVENGLEMKDSATGQTYCVRITNGEFAKVQGSCEMGTIPEPDGAHQSAGGDTVAPTLVVNGNNPANVEVGANYSDLGAMVTDNVDSNLGVKASLDNATWIEIGSLQLNTASSTTYTIYYRSVDNAGNIGTATRTVNIGTAVLDAGVEATPVAPAADSTATSTSTSASEEPTPTTPSETDTPPQAGGEEELPATSAPEIATTTPPTP